jgi:hypothetical protein
MIEINLIPDVKQELLNANRVRTYVMSGAVITGIVAVAIVVLMALYLFTVQGIRSNLTDSSITEKSKQLNGIADLSNMLTIQNQLSRLSEMHASKNIDSRIFDLLTAVNPAPPNQVAVSSAKIDAETKTVTIEGQAVNGYEAAESLKKTILSTSVTYRDESNKTVTTPLTEDVSTSEMSYGEDATGKKVLRFTMSFTYADVFFARSSKDAVIIRPDMKNVTDSYLRIPQSLFGARADNIQEGQQ